MDMLLVLQVGYGHKAQGKALGTAAHPHLEVWQAGRELVADGNTFFAERIKEVIAKQRGGDTACKDKPQSPKLHTIPRGYF